MPIEPVIGGTELSYYLRAYDKDGTERREGNDEFLSERLEKDLSSGAVSDVFMFSHGLKGDVPDGARPIWPVGEGHGGPER